MGKKNKKSKGSNATRKKDASAKLPTPSPTAELPISHQVEPTITGLSAKDLVTTPPPPQAEVPSLVLVDSHIQVGQPNPVTSVELGGVTTAGAARGGNVSQVDSGQASGPESEGEWQTAVPRRNRAELAQEVMGPKRGQPTDLGWGAKRLSVVPVVDEVKDAVETLEAKPKSVVWPSVVPAVRSVPNDFQPVFQSRQTWPQTEKDLKTPPGSDVSAESITPTVLVAVEVPKPPKRDVISSDEGVALSGDELESERAESGLVPADPPVPAQPPFVETFGGAVEPPLKSPLTSDPVVKHPLNHEWTLWSNVIGGVYSHNWSSNLMSVMSFNTIEDFWATYHHFIVYNTVPNNPNKVDYSVFKRGISPTWEDEANSAGGRWCVKQSKRDSQVNWLEVLMFIIGEEDLGLSDLVNGAVLSVRGKQDKISLWLKTAQTHLKKRITTVGQTLKVRMDSRDTIYYEAHLHSKEKTGSNIVASFTA